MASTSKCFVLICALVVGVLKVALGASDGVIHFGVDPTSGLASAVVVKDCPLVFTSQLLPSDVHGELIGEGDAAAQTDQVLQSLDRVLQSAKSDLAHVVKLNVYVALPEAVPAVRLSLKRRFAAIDKPALALIVTTLPHPRALVAIDAVAISQVETKEVQWLSPGSARISSAAVLPVGPKIFVSGMADTNALPIATRKTLEKLVSAIGYLGVQKSDITQLKAFLQPMSDVAIVRKEIASFFGDAVPPVVFVEWFSPSPNPPIEIELIASAKAMNANTNNVTFLTPPGTTSTKVFSRISRVDNGSLIFISGLSGAKSQASAGQVREIFESLGNLLKGTGSDFQHLVKATYYVTDDKASTSLNDIRSEFFDPLRPPAASKAKVKTVGDPGRSVEMDMIAITR